MSCKLTVDDNYIDECNRCLHCGKPSCKAACPVSNDIPAFLTCVRNGDLDKAAQVIAHPFGEVCGYVCPHENGCYGNCVLSKSGKAVRISEVEKAVFAIHPYKVERIGKALAGLKIAVVGGGVSGITFATKVYEQGADVTVFEKDSLLSTLKLIPEFRLPRSSIERIEREIDGKFNVVKKEITAQNFSQLQADFDVVYVATGGSHAYGLGVDGSELATPYEQFLKGKNPQGDVVVIGGGNTAIDCARLAKRNGCCVTVAYRRTKADMPAFTKEIDEAYADGVQFSYNVAPVKLEKTGSKLRLTLAETVNEGRGKLTVTDKTTQLSCDCVVSALGSAFDSGLYGNAQIGADAKHPFAKVYAGGDATGGKIVANAVSDGIETAKMLKELRKE